MNFIQDVPMYGNILDVPREQHLLYTRTCRTYLDICVITFMILQVLQVTTIFKLQIISQFILNK